MMDACRTKLLSAGFQEATDIPGRFYRKDTDLTAFIVNLRHADGALTLDYGWASTAFTRLAGNADALVRFGCHSDDLLIPGRVSLGPSAEDAVRALYDAHRGTDKNALLAIVRRQRADRRKAIIARVDAHMKPLVLRRRGAKWQCPLSDRLRLILSLTCSSYAEEYGLELDIATNDDPSQYCVSREFHLPGHHSHRFDWQTTPADQADAYLREAADCVRHLLTAPLGELGREPDILRHAICTRQTCERCWLREAASR